MSTGRISKRLCFRPQTAGESGNAADDRKKRYKAGVYARLSADKDEKKESIDVQIRIAEQFVEEFNKKSNETIDIAGRYCDLGKTGSNFNRDGFHRLMQDIRLGDINCVIVKDLSRFGRNYLEAGNYIERIFPFLGVRFIAVSDGYDTGEEGNDTEQMASEIKNLVNDMYAKDISVKAKAGLKQRRKAGSYVGGPPPYGYKAVREKKRRKLIPDENTAEIVRYIYQSFAEKESYAAVTDDLNRKRVNPPAVYRETKAVYCLPDMEYKGWDKSAVERIIRSRTYAGVLAQGRSSITARNESSRIRKPEEEWVVSENAHEALVSPELYRKAQETGEKLRSIRESFRHPAKELPIGENVFEHVLCCGVCGKKMTRNSHVKTYADGSGVRLDGYFCRNSGQTKNGNCPQTNRMTVKELTRLLIPLLCLEFGIYLGSPERFIEAGKEQMHTAALRMDKEIKVIRIRMQRMKEKDTDAYMDYRDGKLSQREYVSFKLRQEDNRRKLERQEKDFEERQKGLKKDREKYLKAIRSLFKLKEGEELTREFVDAFIEKIYVYPGKRIEVQFRYVNEMLERAV